MSIKWIEIPPPERKSIFLYWACYNPYRGAKERRNPLSINF